MITKNWNSGVPSRSAVSCSAASIVRPIFILSETARNSVPTGLGHLVGDDADRLGDRQARAQAAHHQLDRVGEVGGELVDAALDQLADHEVRQADADEQADAGARAGAAAPLNKSSTIIDGGEADRGHHILAERPALAGLAQPELEQGRVGDEALGEAVALGLALREDALAAAPGRRPRTSGCAARAALRAGACTSLPADGPAKAAKSSSSVAGSAGHQQDQSQTTAFRLPRLGAIRGPAVRPPATTPPSASSRPSDLKLPSLPSSEPPPARRLLGRGFAVACSTVRLEQLAERLRQLGRLGDLGERLAELGRLRGGLGVERQDDVDLALDRMLEILAADLLDARPGRGWRRRSPAPAAHWP